MIWKLGFTHHTHASCRIQLKKKQTSPRSGKRERSSRTQSRSGADYLQSQTASRFLLGHAARIHVQSSTCQARSLASTSATERVCNPRRLLTSFLSPAFNNSPKRCTLSSVSWSMIEEYRKRKNQPWCHCRYRKNPVSFDSLSSVSQTWCEKLESVRMTGCVLCSRPPASKTTIFPVFKEL